MKYFPALVLLMAIAMGCKKETETSFCLDGAVKWGGDPAADGLGWYLMDSVGGGIANYIPKNLPDSLKTAGLSVHVCLYETSEKFYCQCVHPLNKYYITSIRRN